MTTKKLLPLSALILLTAAFAFAQKPKLTLDEFFNSVSFPSVEISPDGNSVAIVAERADWDQQIFRNDLWLYREDAKRSSLVQLTPSGHDSDPQWSPDNRWIAFLSERKNAGGKSADADSDSKDEGTSQVYLISPNGGEAFAITQGEEDVHAFSWSADSQTIYFATRQPWSKSQKDDYKKEWKDIIQYRASERGDNIYALNVASAIARRDAAPATVGPEKDKDETEGFTPGARLISTPSLRVDSLVTSPDGNKLAFLTNAINQRQEKYEDVELYVIDLDGSLTRHIERRVTNNQAVEVRPHWANNSRHIFFSV